MPDNHQTPANRRSNDQLSSKAYDGKSYGSGGGLKDQANHTDTFNQNANTAWDRHDQDKGQERPSKESEEKRKDENNLTDTYNKNARR